MAEVTRRLSQLGAELIHDDFTILTHCNTGALATAGYGTALGVIKQAKEQGGVLALSDVGLMLGLSPQAIHKAIEEYHKEHSN